MNFEEKKNLLIQMKFIKIRLTQQKNLNMDLTKEMNVTKPFGPTIGRNTSYS